MYLTHPVRRIRDDPDPEASVALVVTPAADAEDTVRSAVESVDGSVDRVTQFDRLVVEVPEEAVATLCERDDVERIETAETLGLGIDGGE